MRNIRKRILAMFISFMMLLGAMPVMASEQSDNTLMADQLEQGSFSAGFEVGRFQIMATEEKVVKVDGNEKVAEDGTAFTQRIKLGGSGNADYRSIHFSTSSSAQVTVYAMSSSSSEDRQLDLYALDGTLVDSMVAPGAGLNMATFTVDSGDYYLASPSSGVNVYGVVIDEATSSVMTLDISSLEQEKLETSKDVNGFTLAATSEKTLTIDSNSKTAEDGTSFTQRLKLGGSGSADYRSIHFTAATNAELTVYAMSSSSSEDRQLDLYTLDGTLVDSMPAPGAGLNMATFTIEAGDYYLASPSSGVNVYGVILEEVTSTTMTIGISSLEQVKLETSKEANGFTIAATSEKTVTIDENSKTAEDGTSYTQRLKLGGSGSADYRSIHFTTGAKAELTVYAMSSSSSSDRQLDLYTLDGTLVDSMEAPGAGLNMKTFTIEAGDYYLASPSSGVNVYEVILVSGQKAEVVRGDWEAVVAPEITNIEADGTTVTVEFTLVTGDDDADKAKVFMSDESGKILAENLVGKSAEDAKSTSFSLSSSGEYTFMVTGYRNGIDEGKDSETMTFDFSLPLSQPVLNAFNNEDGSITVKWNSIEEATSYIVEQRLEGSEAFTKALETEALEGIISGLTVGSTYELQVKAVRGSDEAVSEVISKKVKEVQEREWAFTYFGQSISSSRNTFEMLDEENFTFKLNSATVKEDGTIQDKGGKFTTYHDGVSFYYTVVDPTTENFELTATFTVDFINPTPDGQEGFGLLAMDSLGELGVSSVNHYTNSAGIIATKFEDTIDGVKYTSKDTLGSRFVTGITDKVLALGDSGIAENGSSIKYGFSYDQDDLIKKGESYTLTLKKTNTGYHAYLEGYDEQILYGVDELLQLDKDNLYVGFAVARGCNVTVSDVVFKTSDPATDPAAMEKPVELVSYSSYTDSPAQTSVAAYDFVYVADVPGTLNVVDAAGTALVKDAKIVVGMDYQASFTLNAGMNNYKITFKPEDGFVPGDNQLLSSYDPVTTDFSVEYKVYSGDVIYVTPDGTADGDGSKEKPLDIETAVLFAAPGQNVELAGGTYSMTKGLVIPRGNDGTQDAMKVLRSAIGSRAILNFKEADKGMQVWGNYWLIKDIDVTETPGNIKGLQIAGDNNIVSGVNAYKNGDTGIQISGTSRETIEKWPANNMIVNCTSYDNMDPGMNNADGFAAKITVGEGNVFDGCMAYNNLDDGWDLFAKIESGPIGKVVIKNSLAFNNGTLTDGTGTGDGNGFKLGGDGIAVAHELINSVAYNNLNDGITSNSNPAVVVKNCTSYGNLGNNISLYGKGSDSRNFVLENTISMAGVSDDDISEMPELASDSNYLSVNKEATNKSGAKLDETIFVNVDMTKMPTRNADGSIDMNGLFELNKKAPTGTGAVVGSEAIDVDSQVVTEGIYYTVQEGDTLARLAYKYYGDAYAWDKIFQANTNILTSPHLIYVGQVILIP